MVVVHSACAHKTNVVNLKTAAHLSHLEPDELEYTLGEAILDGRQPAEMTLAVLMRLFSAGWREQRVLLS
jgi:hypothetical protein